MYHCSQSALCWASLDTCTCDKYTVFRYWWIWLAIILLKISVSIFIRDTFCNLALFWHHQPVHTGEWWPGPVSSTGSLPFNAALSGSSTVHRWGSVWNNLVLPPICQRQILTADLILSPLTVLFKVCALRSNPTKLQYQEHIHFLCCSDAGTQLATAVLSDHLPSVADAVVKVLHFQHLWTWDVKQKEARRQDYGLQRK